jgi:hypothetical protein
MFNNNLRIYRNFFKKINYKKLLSEIFYHEKKLDKVLVKTQIKLPKGAGLNFIGREYKELNKILKCIYDFNLFYKFFKSKFILNNCSAVTLYPSGNNYQRSAKWHRDTRYYNPKAKSEMLLLVIPVTNSSIKNGTTKYKIKKNNKYIHVQPELNPGDLLVADARTLHKGGINTSNKPRTIITICITPPHIKPVINFSNFIKNPEEMKDYQLQLMGYYSRTPETLFDFFKPESERFFLKNQMRL